MLALKRHPLVRTDLHAAFDWYEDQRPGLGYEFAMEFRSALRRLRDGPLLYSIRFADVRRLNLDRFPYGLFYVVRTAEIRLMAVLHGSRDIEPILAERRLHFEVR